MKNRQEIIRALAQEESDKILLASALDKWEICRTRNYLTHTKFLDLRQRSLVAQAAALAGVGNQMVMAGGYEEAERAAAVFFPEYVTAQSAQYGADAPITAIRAHKSRADSLSHRDYLGALMGMQIARSCIGDILMHDEGADIIILSEIEPFVSLHFEKAGRKRLRLEPVAFEQLRWSAPTYDVRTGTVSSLRLDNFVSLAFGISRSKAQEAIGKELVFINDICVCRNEKEVGPGDRLTVRGKGRAKILSVGGLSRKGKQYIEYAVLQG